MKEKGTYVIQFVYQNFNVIIVAMLMSSLLFLFLRPLAIKLSLLDYPNKRKTHQGQIPLIGGICIFLSSLLTLFIFFETFSINLVTIIICGGLMLVLGIVDDKLDLQASKKLFFQTLITLIFIIATDCVINDLGTPLGFSSSIELGLLSIPFTLFAIVGLTNAINMIDGCDGLASSLVIISLLALLIFGATGLNDPNTQWLVIVVSSLIAFLFFNFSSNKNIKIFLGDGGSLFIGFFVATSLVISVSKNKLYDPSIVLWFTAVPIFDLVTVIVRRKLLKRKIMVADKSHIHHLLLSWGLSHFQTTALICLTSVALLLFGVFVTTNHPTLGFWSFLLTFLLYLSFRMFSSKAK